MTEWIIIGVAYFAILLLVWIIGGFAAAATAFRDWGRASSRVCPAERN
jgi:hypothetical protein